MRQFEFNCGGVEPAHGEDDARRIAMDVRGQRTVNLRISDISRAMVSDVPDLLLDLLEIASYVYCGDQRATRGTEKLSNAGTLWRRGMRFVIPVRHPDIWSGGELRDALQSTLGFLSDDTYEFEFVAGAASVADRTMYFSDLAEGMFDPEEVALFSGGIDSFAGAVESIVRKGRRTVLVGHHSAEKVFAVQKELVDILKLAGHGAKLRYIPVNVTNANIDPAEPTQRSRSFLFASLAFVVAQMFGRGEFTFFENGIVSLNLPIAQDVLGSRATKTTHPRVIRGFEEIFSVLAQRPIEVLTPFLWLTKKEVVERIVAGGFGAALSRTVSCVHPILWTREIRHCGRCSQCIDRRFGVLAAGADDLDPADGYAVDLLTGPRDADEDLRLAVDYVKFARSLSNSSRQQFPLENPDIYAAASYVTGLTTNEALDRFWELHERHAQAVNSVIETGLAMNSPELVRDRLPPGALLNLCFARERIEAPPMDPHLDQVAAFMDRLQRPVCDFAVDERQERIRFRGGFSLDGGDYHLVIALLPRHRTAKRNDAEVPFTLDCDLADQMGVEENSVRQAIRRVRKRMEPWLATEQGVVLPDGFIENRHGFGRRLAPELREVTLVDLSAADGVTSQIK